jgi:predicted lipid-binding transport protein (Tim44 family)
MEACEFRHRPHLDLCIYLNFGNMTMKLWTLALSLVMVLFSLQADAARMGGGRSIGKQSGNVTQRQAAPAQGANATNKPAPAAAAPNRPWGAMLGGLAAGLGLAWLASSLGMGEGMGQFLMYALLAMAAFMAIRFFMRSRRPADASQGPFAFQGAGNVPVSNSQTYRPENVGNDASARPWEQQATAFDSSATGASSSGSMIGSALSGSQAWGVPQGFDTDGFLRAAKANFITLQAAWDKSDVSSLRSMMTDTMLLEIKSQLSEREAHAGAAGNHTEVVMIEAHLLGIEETADEYLASVEFSGMIREDASAGPSPFREVWNMTKPISGGGWLVAGVQALQ